MPSLMFVAAHPDDEAFGVGPSIVLHAGDPDLRFVLVHATDGAAGEIAADSNVDQADLGAARRREAQDGWRAMGRIPDRHVWLDLPDGGLADHPFEDLVERIGVVMDEERPDVVITFGPDGISGHPDHVAVGLATTVGFERRAGTGPGFHRLLHVAIPMSWIERWNRKRAEQGLEPWDEVKPFHLRGVPDATIGIEVDTEAAVERVIAGVRAHRTQWSYLTMDSDTALADSLRRNHFVIAWPPTTEGQPPLSDVFEQL